MKDSLAVLFDIPVEKAVFLERLSRFSVKVRRDDASLTLHLTNTGRLQDLLRPDVDIVYQPLRTEKCDGRILGVAVPGGVAILDTRLQSSAFEAAYRRGLIPWLEGLELKGKEVLVERSRVDYLFKDPGDRLVYVELKSAVYMNEAGGAMYPDTVSERGRKHCALLAKLARRNGAKVVFVAAHPHAEFFTPCDEADPLIRPLLLKAASEGVEVRAVKTFMDKKGLVYWSLSDLPVDLTPREK
ncbi:MAG: DNA/RNA nuclease SfsA [Candidatus Caldarchaeum sp.]|nr:DNA/RNA nuclease SfsA [Candidatus Caldarchaeum sp.]